MVAARHPVKFLKLAAMPILKQLQLEEALLRATTHNWFLINEGTPQPSIVMGVSGKVEELIKVGQARSRDLGVIKRFTGGGTVVVDADTIFTTLIMKDGAVPGLECFPVPIMRWTEQFYLDVFQKHGGFKLREHDYVFGERKFGGNAQAITSKRWLHHTSFLWDYDARNMAVLTNPKKQPAYRQQRDHEEFVVRLKDVISDKQQLLRDLEDNAAKHYDLQEVSLEEASEALQKDYLRNNKVINLEDHVS